MRVQMERRPLSSMCTEVDRLFAAAHLVRMGDIYIVIEWGEQSLQDDTASTPNCKT